MATTRIISIAFGLTAISIEPMELDKWKLVLRYITHVHNKRELLFFINNMKHGDGVNFCGYVRQIESEQNLVQITR
jgi:hypothetical protein